MFATALRCSPTQVSTKNIAADSLVRPTALPSYNNPPFTITTSNNRKQNIFNDNINQRKQSQLIASIECSRLSQSTSRMPSIVECEIDNIHPQCSLETTTCIREQRVVPVQFKVRISDEYGRRINSIESPGSDLFDAFEQEDDDTVKASNAFRCRNLDSEYTTQICRKCGHGKKNGQHLMSFE